MQPFKSDGVAPVKSPAPKNHGGYVELRVPKVQLYKNLEIVGTLPGSDLKEGRKFTRRISPYAKLYGNVSYGELVDIAGDTFYVVQTTNSNYYTTVNSWDQKPDYSYKGTPKHNFGLAFLEQYYGDIMVDCVASSEEVCEYIDWSKSPGWPHTYYGFRTKAELVAALSHTLFFERTSTLPIWNVSGKVEFKNKAEIEANKIRLFQIPSFELLYSQLKFGKRISNRLLNKHWSAFGFNPYSGGFDRLARRLLSKRWRGCYDVSGWDKFMSLLEDIYLIVAKKSLPGISEFDLTEFIWMVQNTCHFLLKTVDGNVLRKTYGNASGSGTTTRDNIFGHVIIFAAGLYKAYLEKNGVPPTMMQVAEQIVALYGDDNVFAVDDEFSLICDPDFLAKHLADYGLKLKFFFGGLDADLHTLSFLGANFKEINGLWYPEYDVIRLATTMVYEKGKMQLSQHLSKAFTLMVMSRPTKHFKVFYKAYDNLVNSDIVQNNLDDTTVRAYAFIGLPEVVTIDAFYTGQESSGIDDLVLDFSPELLNSF